MKTTLFTLDEAAQIIGVNPKTLLRWEQQGYIATLHKNPKGVRYYSFENLSHLHYLKNSNLMYMFRMYNGGLLPNTIRATGLITYDNGMSKRESDIRPGDTLAGAMMCYADYRKRPLSPKQVSELPKYSLKELYLKHHDPNHDGPVSIPYVNPIQLTESDACDAHLCFWDMWREDRMRTGNLQALCPKSMLGFEFYTDEHGNDAARYVKYERYAGMEWLADD